MSRVQAERDRDEQLLLRLFRWLHDCERSEVMQYAAEVLAKRVSLDPHLGRYSEPAAKTLANELEEDFHSRLRRTMPPQEPWDYLDDWIDHTVAYAWGDETGNVIFGSCVFDDAYAGQLLREVEETAANQRFPEPPGFDVDQMAFFIQQWRERALSALERNAEQYARIVVADVDYTPSDETFYVLKRQSQQSLYLAESLAVVEEKLKADGWWNYGVVIRWDEVPVALWSLSNNEYLAVWDSKEKPIRERGK